MEVGRVVAIVCGASGAAVAGLSIPLYLKRVRPNLVYGARWPAALASEASWYAVNRAAGGVGILVGLAYAALCALFIVWPPRTVLWVNVLSFSPIALALAWLVVARLVAPKGV